VFATRLFLEARFWGFASFWRSIVSPSYLYEKGDDILERGRVALFADGAFLAF
jgi:hypothetical protein